MGTSSLSTCVWELTVYSSHPFKYEDQGFHRKTQREAEENQKEKKMQPHINIHKHVSTVSQCMRKIKGTFGRLLPFLNKAY